MTIRVKSVRLYSANNVIIADVKAKRGSYIDVDLARFNELQRINGINLHEHIFEEGATISFLTYVDPSGEEYLPASVNMTVLPGQVLSSIAPTNFEIVNNESAQS